MVQHAQSLLRVVDSHISAIDKGLEIAPYFEPLFAKSSHSVLYTDYIGTEEIRDKAAANIGLNGQDIPAVDFIWTPGRPLTECSPAGSQFDYVVASHVMEHVPDPLGWLNEIFSVVRDGGKVALFLPDRRKTSDFFRNETEFYQLVQWWLERSPIPTPGQILDFMCTAFRLEHHMGNIWATDGQPINVSRPYTDADALNFATFVYNERQYVDIHCTVWNGDAFGRIFERVIASGIINAEITTIACEESEFLVIFTKLGNPTQLPPHRKLEVAPPAADPLEVKQILPSASVAQIDARPKRFWHRLLGQ